MASNEDAVSAPSLKDTSVLITDSSEDGPWGKNVKSRYYTLPYFRMTFVVKVILIIDALTSLAFWLTGTWLCYLIL